MPKRMMCSAQVMLTKNMPEHALVNGSRGLVVGYSERHCADYGVQPSKVLVGW